MPVCGFSTNVTKLLLKFIFSTPSPPASNGKAVVGKNALQETGFSDKPIDETDPTKVIPFYDA